MRSLFSVLAFFALYQSALAARPAKILDCNITFGDIAQITIFQDGRQLSYSLLTNTGRMLPPQPLDAAMWERHDLRFEYRGEQYKFYSEDEGRTWGYEISNPLSPRPHTIGGADCD